MNPSIYLLDSARITDVLKDLLKDESRRAEKSRRWCCAVCKAFITDDEAGIDVNGKHEHYHVNPQGLSFGFRSYSRADGCNCIGQLTAEYSWFTGLLWRFAHCASCHSQLGWYFSGRESFYGLIVSRLVPCTDH
jgi:hypothetical protein